MSLLGALFGSSNKNSTTSTTNATQNTSNVSADAGSILAGEGASVSIDNSTSEDYRFTDSRDMSTHLQDNSNNSDNSVRTDARSYSEINYNLAPDVVVAALGNADAIDERRSGDTRFAIGEAYNASLEFFDSATSALRSAYESNAENLADSNIRSIQAVTEATRTDGQGILDTVNKFGKYAALIIGAGVLVALFRS